MSVVIAILYTYVRLLELFSVDILYPLKGQYTSFCPQAASLAAPLYAAIPHPMEFTSGGAMAGVSPLLLSTFSFWHDSVRTELGIKCWVGDLPFDCTISFFFFFLTWKNMIIFMDLDNCTCERMINHHPIIRWAMSLMFTHVYDFSHVLIMAQK